MFYRLLYPNTETLPINTTHGASNKSPKPRKSMIFPVLMKTMILAFLVPHTRRDVWWSGWTKKLTVIVRQIFPRGRKTCERACTKVKCANPPFVLVYRPPQIYCGGGATLTGHVFKSPFTGRLSFQRNKRQLFVALTSTRLYPLDSTRFTEPSWNSRTPLRTCATAQLLSTSSR